MRIYTRRGDDGYTYVIGARIGKEDPRIEALGAIDELNAWIGIAIAAAAEHPRLRDVAEHLAGIQHELFELGAVLATVEDKTDDRHDRHNMPPGGAERLERMIDAYDSELSPLSRFILPGGTVPACWLHVCRTVCRRAERRIVALAKTATVPQEIMRYLNRLSDLLFVMARISNSRLGVRDIEHGGQKGERDDSS
ncbi:MAG: ATP:cob(I)alamin adenosyltransferase [Candidatus Reconcilbacillus cellulovorans]|uniref:Corrinoid adenosyltransferase n=1 Tax=Candidatus Reconcilbacillus cellulovorans TaxID=1906605 RepID=A0A2A6DZB4_9BACL|nr:MAG: ATP:cob(I)alamin adenosyltransferase [Candidatus Reconcilbacillus cellulovorans]